MITPRIVELALNTWVHLKAQLNEEYLPKILTKTGTHGRIMIQLGGANMNTIGDRIKIKRKELGLTQAELGKKLHVTDRAVSKWEQNDGNPDFSILPQLAEILNVTLDYLITGKVVEPVINFDDMDEEKRALYFIKKDDVANFEKYGYINSSIIISNMYGRSDSRRDSNLLSAIYTNESKAIFKRCLMESLSKFNDNRIVGINRVQCIRGSIDDYIKMCCKSGCVEGLQFIDLKYFTVGDKTDITNGFSFHIREEYNPASSGYKTFTISKAVLDYIFSDSSVSDQIKDYLTTIEFYRDGGNKIYLMTDYIVYQLYKNKLFDKLRNALKELEDYNIFAETVYKESIRGSWYTGKHVTNNAIYFTNGGSSFLRAYVTPISRALELAKSTKDFEWLKVFNEYNKNLSEKIPDLRISFLKDDEIKLMELENKNTPLEDLISIKFLSGNLLLIKRLLSSEYGLNATDKAERIKQKIAQIKSLNNFIKTHYICVPEFIFDCLQKKQYKPLFKFATDLQYAELQNAVIDGNNDLVLEITRKLFIPTEQTLKKLRTIDDFYSVVMRDNGIDAAKTHEVRMAEYNEYIGKETQKFIDKKTHEYWNVLDRGLYQSLLVLQFDTIPLSEIYSSLALETIQDIKQRMINEAIVKYEEDLETVTHEKALKKEYDRISAELSKEYLLSELNKGESDKVVVLICKRLQIILEYKFRYSGDLFTMIDALINQTMQLHNCRDDEDNNYRRYQEEDRISSKRIQLLHTLRMKRNNIVHAETKNIDMTIDEIKECIDLIEFLSK